MTAPEVNALVAEWQRTGSRRAGNAVVRAEGRIVVRLARRMRGIVREDELQGVGHVAFAAAMRSWEPARGPFFAIARFYVRRAMTHAVKAACATKRSARLGVYDVPAEGDMPDARLIRAAVARAVADFTMSLTARERTVLLARADSRTFREVGALIGQSYGRAQQIDALVRTIAREKLGGLL